MVQLGRYIDTKHDRVECPHVDIHGDELAPRKHPTIHPLIVSIFDEGRERWGSPSVGL